MAAEAAGEGRGRSTQAAGGQLVQRCHALVSFAWWLVMDVTARTQVSVIVYVGVVSVSTQVVLDLRLTMSI